MIKLITIFWVYHFLCAPVFSAPIPASWYGNWRGEGVRIARGSLSVETSTLEISEIAGSNNLIWKITHDGEPTRNYIMLAKNLALGHYLLDEKNGIFIDHYFINNQLRSFYSVNNRFISVHTKMNKNRLEQETMIYGQMHSLVSGAYGATFVSSYPFISCHSLLFKKD